MSPRWSFVPLLTCAALVAAGGAAAQVVVLFARGPSAGAYPAGRVLPANQVVSLKAGDQLELLDGGGSHVLTGPAVVTAGHVAPKVRDELIGVFLKAQRSRPGIAASRGLDGGRAAAPDLWQADVGVDGAVCLAKGAVAGLWGGASGTSASVRITRLATGETVGVSLPVDRTGAAWPDSLPTGDGERYSLTLDDGSTTALVWTILDPAPPTLGDLATALLDEGCYDQLSRVRSAFAAE